MYIQITTRCNMNCAHCCNYDQNKEDMPLSIFKKAIEKWGKQLQTQNREIIIGGGEPTIHPDFWEILKIAKEYGLPWIATNGKKTRDVLKLIKMAKRGEIHLVLSLDKWHEKIDDKVVETFTDGLVQHSETAWFPKNQNGEFVDRRELRVINNPIYGGKWTDTEEKDCCCREVRIKPNGDILVCGCESVKAENCPKIGTVTEGIYKAYKYVDYVNIKYCYKDYFMDKDGYYKLKDNKAQKSREMKIAFEEEQRNVDTSIELKDCQDFSEFKDFFICKRFLNKFNIEYKAHKTECQTCKLTSSSDKTLYHRIIMNILFRTEYNKQIYRLKKYISKNDDLLENIEKIILTTKIKYGKIENVPITEFPFVRNIKALNIKRFNKLMTDDDVAYKKWIKTISPNLSQIYTDFINTKFKTDITNKKINKKYLNRFINEHYYNFDNVSLKQLQESIDDAFVLKNISSHNDNKVSLSEKIIGIMGAFERIKKRVEKEGKKAVWADEKEIIERQICCTTCSDGKSCPYCGCGIKRRWFMPLGKSELNTEGCPNPKTYPHLKKYPPRNYWKVCKEETTAILPIFKSEKAININNTIKSLIDTATGKLKILLLLDSFEDKEKLLTQYKDVPIRIIENAEYKGSRYTINEGYRQADTKYVFKVDAHCKMTYGWDTKLKCVCDDKTLAVNVIGVLESDWENTRNGNYSNVIINEEMEEKWEKDDNKDKKINEIMSLTGCGFMMTKKGYFDVFGGFDENLAKWGAMGPELSVKLERNGGRILIRKDVACYHIFHTNKKGYSLKDANATRKYLLQEYSKELQQLQNKFNIEKK